MLFLLFQLGRDRYAIDVNEVAEVLPLVGIKAIPHAPTGVVGVFNYRGSPVPVIDLSALAIGRSAANCLSTRLVVVHYAIGTGERRLLALIAEKATETLRRDAADFVPAGVDPAEASYLGPVVTDAHGVIQWIMPEALLPSAVRDVLFRELLEA